MAISMKLSPFIHHWALIFLPYQNLSHFRTYFNFFTDLTLYQSVTARRKVYLLYLIYIAFCFLNLYLWFFRPPPMARLRQGDFVSLVIQTDSFYLATPTLGLMSIYFMHVLCFTMKAAFLRLLEDTLFRDSHRTLTGVAYGTHTEQATIRIFILGLGNLLHVFIHTIDGIFLFVIYSLLNAAIESPGELLGNPLDTPLTFIGNVICILFGTWTTATAVAMYGKICINVATVGSGHLFLLFRRLYHSETLLSVYRQRERPFSWDPFGWYLRYSGQTFRILFTANGLYGRLFFAFMVVHMPMSAWAIVELVLGELSQWSSIVLSSMPAHELLACVLLHWGMAKLTKRLHAPSKALLSLNASTGHRMGNFRARLLLHHTIVRLHTKAKYGFTYGSVGGLITMGSFGKCMLLYIELLMYAYKLIRDI